MGTSKITGDLLFGIPTLVMPDQHDPLAADLGQATDHGRIIAKMPISMDFPEFPTDQLNVIPKQRPLGMPGDLNCLPGTQILEGFFQYLDVTCPKLSQFGAVIDLTSLLLKFKLFDLSLELGDGFFEFERVSFCGC